MARASATARAPAALLAATLALLLGTVQAYAQVAAPAPPAVAAAVLQQLRKDAWLVSGWRVTETRRGGGKCKYVAEARVRGPAGSTLVVIPSAGGLKPRDVPASALPAGPARAACAGAEVQVKARRAKAYELAEDEVAVDVKVGKRSKCGKFKIQLLAADGGACEVGPVYDAEGGAISDGGSGGSGSGTKGKVSFGAAARASAEVLTREGRGSSPGPVGGDVRHQRRRLRGPRALHHRHQRRRLPAGWRRELHLGQELQPSQGRGKAVEQVDGDQSGRHWQESLRVKVRERAVPR